MHLTDIRPGQTLAGIEPNQNVSVVAAVPLSEATIRLVYQTPDGRLKDRLLGRTDEAEIALAVTERPFAFDGSMATPSPSNWPARPSASISPFSSTP